MKKFRCFEYDPVIYPRKLWVCVNGEVTDIASEFDESVGVDKVISQEDVDNSHALTFPAIHHESREYGVVVWIHNVDCCDASTITHEAIHAVNYMFDALGMSLDIDNDEAQAYLGGFIGASIDKTMKKCSSKVSKC